MFRKSKNTEQMAKTNEVITQEVNRIITGTTIDGEIKTDGGIRIDGVIVGTVSSKGKLVVGPTGKVEGEVNCQNADIFGTLKGKITVSGLLHLKSTAKITGDILTNKLAIDPGAIFTGSCSMGTVIKEMSHVDSKKEDRQKEKSA